MINILSNTIYFKDTENEEDYTEKKAFNFHPLADEIERKKDNFHESKVAQNLFNQRVQQY